MSTDVLALPLPDAASTRALGHVLGTGLFEGAVILLHGPLGAGKTCLVGGLAAAAGVVGPVHSPTYILIVEYPEARVPLRHADLYRLEDPREVDALHLDERVGRDGAWCVEWAERAEAGTWPADRLELRLAVVDGGRSATIEATGPRHARWLAHVRAAHANKMGGAS
jgi:tRNA threonylcarbamoyladenosine biosynthesis protein TsaE